MVGYTDFGGDTDGVGCGERGGLSEGVWHQMYWVRSPSHPHMNPRWTEEAEETTDSRFRLRRGKHQCLRCHRCHPFSARPAVVLENPVGLALLPTCAINIRTVYVLSGSLNIFRFLDMYRCRDGEMNNRNCSLNQCSRNRFPFKQITCFTVNGSAVSPYHCQEYVSSNSCKKALSATNDKLQHQRESLNPTEEVTPTTPPKRDR